MVDTKIGDKIRLLDAPDAWIGLEPGLTGVVRKIDLRYGIVEVAWDDKPGSVAGLVMGHDRWEVLS
jgi:hypothetical protein